MHFRAAFKGALIALVLAVSFPINAQNHCGLLFDENFTQSAFAPGGTEWVFVNGEYVLPLFGTTAIVRSVDHLIKSVQQSFYMEMYTLRDEELISQIEQLALRGTEVRLVLADPNGRMGRKSDIDLDLRTILRLRSAGARVNVISTLDINRETSYLQAENHIKLVIIDGKTAYIGSSNLYYKANNLDVGVLISGPTVNKFLHKFNSHFISSDRNSRRLLEAEIEPFATLQTSIKILESRDSFGGIRAEFLERLERAQQSVIISYWEFSDPEILAALAAKKRAYPEFQIYALMGPSRRAHFKVLGVDYIKPMNLEAFMALKALGAHVAWFVDPEGSSILHAKVAVFDDTWIILGNADLTARSLGGNLELDILFESPIVAQQITTLLKAQIASGDINSKHSRWDRFKNHFNKSIEIALMQLKRARNKITGIAQSMGDIHYLEIIARQKFMTLKRAIFPLYEAQPISTSNSLPTTLSALDSAAKLRGLTLKEDKSNQGVKAISSEKSIYLYGGYSRKRALNIWLNGSLWSANGQFGGGLYLTSSPDTALDYGFWRTSQAEGNQGVSHVIVYQVKVQSIFNYRTQYQEFKQWLNNGGRGHAHMKRNDLLARFCRESGYEAIVLPNEEGLGRDYYLIFDLTKAVPMQLQEFHNPQI